MADFANVQPDKYLLLGCNFTAGRPFGIKGVTIHHMAGDLTGEQCNGVWRNAGTSAHYSVDRNGYIVQHVHDTDRAWACGDGIGTGRGNDTTISIEHANSGSNPWTVHEKAIESGAHLVAALCLFYKLGRPAWMVNVFPHKHWSSTACPGELAGSQRDHYMQRAQAWYDAMTGGKPTPKPSTSASKPQQSEPAQVTVDGFWGPSTTKRAQQLAGLVADGEVWGQYSGNRHRFKGCTGGWKWNSSPKGSPLIRWMQANVLHIAADGIAGKDFANAMIRKYGNGCQDGKLDGPSVAIKGLQKALNEGHF